MMISEAGDEDADEKLMILMMVMMMMEIWQVKREKRKRLEAEHPSTHPPPLTNHQAISAWSMRAIETYIKNCRLFQ